MLSQKTDPSGDVADGPVDEGVRARLAERVGELARATGVTVTVAESLTGGMISAALAEAEGSSAWFLGGVVAYASEVKFAVLGVPEGPVVTAEAAGAMARGVRTLMEADVAVAVTGAAGPSPQDGQDPGTVFVAFDDGARAHEVIRLALQDSPRAICETTAVAALRTLVDGLEARG